MIAARLRIDPQGTVRCLYTEAIDLRSLGPLEVVRAAEVRFDPDSQQWEVLTPNGDAVLYRNPSRQACLDWEQASLQPGREGFASAVEVALPQHDGDITGRKTVK